MEHYLGSVVQVLCNTQTHSYMTLRLGRRPCGPGNVHGDSSLLLLLLKIPQTQLTQVLPEEASGPGLNYKGE